MPKKLHPYRIVVTKTFTALRDDRVRLRLSQEQLGALSGIPRWKIALHETFRRALTPAEEAAVRRALSRAKSRHDGDLKSELSAAVADGGLPAA